MGHTSAGHGVSGTDLIGCVSSLDIPRASWRRPLSFNPLRRGNVYILMLNRLYIYIYIYIYKVHKISFLTFFPWAFKIVFDP